MPDAIIKLRDLRQLNLEGNYRLKQLPDWEEGFPLLRIFLTYGSHNLEELPIGIYNSPNMSTMSMSGPKLRLSKDIMKLKKLRSLIINRNGFPIPDEVNSLPNLKELGILPEK